MRKRVSLLLALLLIFSCTACGGETNVSPSSEQVPPPQAQAEEALPQRPAEFAQALQNRELQSILVVGDSISDGNGDDGCLYSDEERIAVNSRAILTMENGHTFYENTLDAQGWVKYFRKAAEACGVEVFHNAAIGGMSAKWFNAHKELLFTPEQPAYDAIFVMLGTNDRTDCETAEEFRTEYGSLLSYLEDHCTYLTVLVPIPAIYDPTDTVKNLTSAQIAENVRVLCEENGYAVIDCYCDFPQYAADFGLPLGALYWGGTHPNHAGYTALWGSILQAPVGSAKAEDPEAITCIGCNLDVLTGDTPIYAVYEDETPIYPLGVSWYYTWNPFTDQLPYGAFFETHREADGTAVQYARNSKYLPTGLSLVRHWQDEHWSDWAEN